MPLVDKGRIEAKKQTSYWQKEEENNKSVIAKRECLERDCGQY